MSNETQLEGVEMEFERLQRQALTHRALNLLRR